MSRTLIEIIIVFIFAGLLYWQFTSNASLTLQNHIKDQNSEYVSDSLNKELTWMHDSVNVMAIRVQKAENNVKIKYLTHIETIHDSGKIQLDSNLFTFQGSQSIAHYSGQIDTVTKTWKLSLTFDDIQHTSELFKDSDGLWKIRVTSLSPGVRIVGYSTADQSLFKHIDNPASAHEYVFGIGANATTSTINVGIILKLDRVAPTLMWGKDGIQLGLFYLLF